jgi:MerR family mercuric resistance operon transcriptional regulator
MKPLTIGKVAQRVGVGIETVRFYERQGLLNSPARSPSSGYRLYESAVITRLQFIQRGKELGFTLNEIKELLSLRVDRGSPCKSVRAKAEAKLADIDGKLEALRKMKKALLRLTQACGRTGGRSECPILVALDGRPGVGPKE